MDISRAEQRILHLLAQGGRIELTRDENRKIEKAVLYTRDGWVFSGLDLITFRKLKSKRAISSSRSQPYRITTRGLELVRGELNNRREQGRRSGTRRFYQSLASSCAGRQAAWLRMPQQTC